MRLPIDAYHPASTAGQRFGGTYGSGEAMLATIRVGIVQMNARPLRVEQNLARAGAAIERLAHDGAELVVLPEMFNVGFYFGAELLEVAEPLDGKTVTWLRAQAAKHGAWLTGSFYEALDGELYNTMVMVAPAGAIQHYRKRNPTLLERAVWRRSEDPGPGIFDTAFGRVGGAICFDSFAAETFAGFARSEVDLVVVVALWGTLPRLTMRPDTWGFGPIMRRWSELAADDVPRGYAEQLRVPTVFVNQAGIIETPLPWPRPWPFRDVEAAAYRFWGRSHVRDATGRIVAGASADDVDYEAVTSVELPPRVHRATIQRVDIAPRYLHRDYYFVAPPLAARAAQAWSQRGYAREYDRRRSAWASRDLRRT